MKIKVVVIQTENRSFFDEEKQQTIEYEATDEIKGEFSSWGEFERFTRIVLRCFPNSIIKVHIEKEDE